MTPISFIKNNNSNYLVSGDLTFATIDRSTIEALTFNQKTIIVDFVVSHSGRQCRISTTRGMVQKGQK